VTNNEHDEDGCLDKNRLSIGHVLEYRPTTINGRHGGRFIVIIIIIIIVVVVVVVTSIVTETPIVETTTATVREIRREMVGTVESIPKQPR
jgi:hypothetical protein